MKPNAMDASTNTTILSKNYVEEHGLASIILSAQVFYIPLICVLGSAGNVLSVLVFFSTKLRKLSSSYYLSALAITDTGVLLPMFVVWLELVDALPLINTVALVCKSSVYVTHTCSFLSVWFVVTFTVERFIAVRYPLQRPSVCTVARAKCVLTVLIVFSMIIHSPYMYMPNIVEVMDRGNKTKLLCDLPIEHKEFANILNLVDLFITFLLPFTIIVVLNTLISRTVWRLARTRRSMTQNKHNRSSRRSRSRPCTSSGGSSASSSQTKVTEMLLIVSTVFICLNSPSYLFRVYLFLKEVADEEKEILIVCQQFALVLYNTNFAINFALYCVSGQNFRRALTSLFCPGLRPSRRETTTITVMSEYTRSITHHGSNNQINSINRRKTVIFNGNNTQEHKLSGQRNEGDTTKYQDEVWDETNDC